MGVKITTRVNQQALREMLTGPNGAVVRELTRRAILVENEAKRLCPVDTGRLRSNITHEVRTGSKAMVARIGTNVAYALDVHEGTGIYGPRGAPIRPKTAKVLRFPVRGRSGPRSRSIKATGWVFTPQVKGMRGRPFLRDALAAARR